jgi:hypothetical protein
MMFTKSVSIIVLWSFIFCFVGCTTMRYVPREDIYEVEKKSSVWVTLADGTRFEVRDPDIDGSRLVGHAEPKGYTEIDLAEIEWLEVKEIDKNKAIKLTAIGLTGGIILLWVLSSDESGSCST